MMSNVDQENGRVQESVMTKEVFKNGGLNKIECPKLDKVTM